MILDSASAGFETNTAVAHQAMQETKRSRGYISWGLESVSREHRYTLHDLSCTSIMHRHDIPFHSSSCTSLINMHIESEC